MDWKESSTSTRMAADGYCGASAQLRSILMMPRADQRVAAALLRAARSGSDPVPLGQSDLSAIANVSPRQVSTAIKAFARSGLIAPGYRRIRILDAEGLRTLVNCVEEKGSVSV